MSEAGKIKIIRGLSSRERWSRITFFGMVLVLLIIGIICIIYSIKWIDKPFHGFLFNQRLVVSTAGQSHWTGVKTGIKFPDKILKANNQILSSSSDLKDVIKNTSAGSPINYSFEIDSQEVELTIPTMHFTLLDFFMVFLPLLFNGFAFLLMGMIVFILKPDTNVSWAHFLACIFLAAFNITNVDIIATHLGFQRVNGFANAFFPAAFLHLSLVFPEQINMFYFNCYLSSSCISQENFNYCQAAGKNCSFRCGNWLTYNYGCISFDISWKRFVGHET